MLAMTSPNAVAMKRAGWIGIGAAPLLLVADLVAAADRLWIHAGAATYHFERDRDKHRNGNNYGIGVEYHLTEKHWLGGGVFRNTYEGYSPYLGYAWVPWDWGRYKAGISIGLAGGYESDDNRLAPAIMPFIAGEWKHVGVNVLVLPTTHGIIALQLKFRF